MGKDNQESRKDELQRELEKHQVALSGVSEKIAAIEEQERREREAKEAKERELLSLQSQLKACQDWILFVEKKITEVKETTASVIKASCSGSKNTYLTLGETLQELAVRELELATFKDYEASLRAKIEAH